MQTETTMFKRIFLAASFLLFTLISLAQVTIERNWKKGDKIEVSTSEVRLDDGEDRANVEAEVTVYSLEVTDETKEYYEVLMTMDNMLEEMNQAISEDDELASSIDIEKLKYRCRFYKNDPRFEVVNADDIRDFMESTFDAIMDLIVAEADEEDEDAEIGTAFVAMIFEGIMEQFSDAQQINNMAAQELYFLIDPYLDNLSEKDKMESDVTCPNPFKPGEEINARRTTWLENYQPDEKSCDVVSNMEMDMSAMLEQMIVMVEEMAKMFMEEGEEWTEEDEAKLEEQRKEIRAMQMEANIQQRMTMDLDSTWPTSVTQTMFLNGSDESGPRETKIETRVEITKVQ